MNPSDFIARYAPYAVQAQVRTGVPASITLAQAILESSWGESSLTTTANNFFGVKDQVNDEWRGDYVTYPTKEFLNGAYVTVNAKFRKYATPEEGFIDHANFLIKNKRYAPLFQLKVTDYVGWAKGLKAAGYATDPTYDSKLIYLVSKYRLDEFDTEGEKKNKLS